MKHVPYVNKHTQAGTQYRKTTSQDLNVVLDTCKQVAAVAGLNIPEVQSLNHPNPKMPRMSNGTRNTCATMAEGVIDNFNNGQYDLSDKQCDGITEMTRIAEDIIDGIEQIVFVEVGVLPKIKPPIIESTPEGTFSDLFDVESITVTYRRK